MKKKINRFIDRIIPNFLLIYICAFYLVCMGLLYGIPLYFLFDIFLGVSLGFGKYFMASIVFIVLGTIISEED